MARLYSATFRFGSSSSSCSSFQDDRCTRVTKPLKSLLFILVCSLLLFCTNSPLPPGFFLVLSGTTKINVGGTGPRGLQLSSEGTAQQENVTALCVGRETQGGVWVELEKEYAWHHPIIDKLPGGHNKTFVMTKHPHWNPAKDAHKWDTNGRSVVFYGCT